MIFRYQLSREFCGVNFDETILCKPGNKEGPINWLFAQSWVVFKYKQCCQMILAETRHEILKNRHFTRQIFGEIGENRRDFIKTRQI